MFLAVLKDKEKNRWKKLEKAKNREKCDGKFVVVLQIVSPFLLFL